MSIEPTLLEQTTQEAPEKTVMSTNQHALKPSELMALKICSALGVLGFTAFMVNSWQTQLTAYNAAQAQTAQTAQTATPPAVVAPVATATSEAPATTEAPTTALATASTPVTETATEMAPEPVAMTSEQSITDQTVLAQLNQKLYETIDTNWKQSPTFSKSLVYQVKVAKDGEIAEYESINLAASEYEKETPLPSLTEAQQTETISPLAKFLVVMTPSGGLEVSPWTAN